MTKHPRTPRTPHSQSRSRRAAGVLAAAALAVGTAVAAAPAAHADSSFTTHLSPGSSFGLLVDVSGGSQTRGAPVIQWYANGGANQAWTFYPVGITNTYEIVNVNSGQCLTTDLVAGDDVYQYPCLGAVTQKWTTTLTGAHDGIPHTIWNAFSGLVLDVSQASQFAGAHLDTWSFNGGSNQSFLSV